MSDPIPQYYGAGMRVANCSRDWRYNATHAGKIAARFAAMREDTAPADIVYEYARIAAHFAILFIERSEVMARCERCGHQVQRMNDGRLIRHFDTRDPKCAVWCDEGGAK